jgi:LAO/AO transport system kinase
MDVVERVLAGERLALARLLTQVENDTAAGRATLDRLFPFTGKAHLVGITGAPGTGKSSLANQLARAFRRLADGSPARTVAVLAIDPSSPFTGGALLGDRLRMKDVSGDPGVFIRSTASRGAVGGLARTTAAMVQVLDAAGFEMIFIETVGAGQSEVEIVRLAHTVLVVDAPGLGDDIQAIKAGILEIADVLVVNKADLPGVENTLRGLNVMLDMAYPEDQVERWRPPLLRAAATTGEGIDGIVRAILDHRTYLVESGKWYQRERMRLKGEFDALLGSLLVSRWRERAGEQELALVIDKIERRELSPAQAVDELLARYP